MKIVKATTILKIKLLFSLYLAKIMGFKFIWAESEEEMKKVYRLRHFVYSSEGHIDPTEDQELKDKYDTKAASNLLVIHKGNPIGTVRIIHDSPLGFPTENLFNIDLTYNRAKIAEISRLCILPAFRKRNFLFGARIVMGAITVKLYRYSKEQDVTVWLFTVPEKLKRSFEAFGIPFVNIETKEPLKRHLQEREVIAAHYFRNLVANPYVIKIDEI